MNKPFKITKPGKYALRKPQSFSHAVIELIDGNRDQPAVGKLIWRNGKGTTTESWAIDGSFFRHEYMNACLDIVGPYKEPKKASQPSARTIRRRFIATLRKHAPGLSPAAVAAIVKAANLPKA